MLVKPTFNSIYYTITPIYITQSCATFDRTKHNHVRTLIPRYTVAWISGSLSSAVNSSFRYEKNSNSFDLACGADTVN